MRILIATDIHGDERALRSLLSRDFDYLVILGDLTNRFREKHLFDLLPSNTLFIPGNNEPLTSGIHGRVVEIAGVKFFTLGGSLPTPFNTPNEIPEEEYKKIIAENSAAIDSSTVILSHSPPYGALDLVGGIHIGIKALRELIILKKPLAVFCGHVHEYSGHMAFINRTPVINPGKSGLLLEV